MLRPEKEFIINYRHELRARLGLSVIIRIHGGALTYE
jgi:hypothetical protein